MAIYIPFVSAIYIYNFLQTTYMEQKINDIVNFVLSTPPAPPVLPPPSSSSSPPPSDLKKAAYNNNPTAMYKLGKYYAQKNISKAIHWFSKSNSAKSLYCLGELYENKKDYINAFQHYNKSHKLGFRKATLKLATFYEQGLGVEKNKDFAAAMMLIYNTIV